MRFHITILVVGLFAGTMAPVVHSQEADPAIMAVFAIQNRGAPLSGQDLNALTDYLGTRLGERGRFQILPREAIRDRLREQKKRSYASCYDQSCQIEIGRELAAELTLSANVSKLGATCLLTAAIFDLRKAATVNTATAKGASCHPDDLLAAVEEVAERLTKQTRAEGRPTAKTLAPKVVAPFPRVIVGLTSDPDETEVLLDGKPMGLTPLQVKVVRGRSYALALRKKGYLPFQRSLQATQDTNLELTLDPDEEHFLQAEPSRTEWIGLDLHLGTTLYETAAGGMWRFVTLKWKSFFWSIAELSISSLPDEQDNTPVMFFGTRAGYPLYLGKRLQHQLRIGLGAGYCMRSPQAELDKNKITVQGFCLAPSVKYIYQTGGWFHIGVGIRTTIPVAVSGQGDLPVLLLVSMPMGWTGAAAENQ